MTTTDNIKLTEEKETLFLTLYAKALDYRSRNSVLNDKTANDIVEKIDINLEKHKEFGNRIIAVRARQLDEWTKNFLSKNKDAVVLNLGCGLDTRIARILPSSQTIWFDVDYPEVIELRKKFFSETSQYKMIASSVTTQDWLETIPADKPTLIIAEGLFSYLSEEEVKSLLNRLTNYFSHGEIIFNIISSSAVRVSKEKLKETTGAVHKWSVDNINEIEKLNPQLKREEVIPLFKSAFMKKLPFAFRFLFGLASLSSKYSNMMQLLRYDF